MSRPLDSSTRKQCRVLQFRTAPTDLGDVFSYRPAAPAADLAAELSRAYARNIGTGLDVQPPYRALEAVLRAATGTWARWQWNDGHYELLCAAPVSSDDRLDVFRYWSEAVVPGPAGQQIGEQLAELVAQAEPRPAAVPPPPRAGRRSRGWWPGELARWRLAEELAALDWPRNNGAPVRFALCTDGRLAATRNALPSEPDRAGLVRHLLPRIVIGTAASGYSRRHALTVNATTTLLATSWKGVSTVLLANPDQPLVVAATTDGPPWARRLNVPAVAASRRLAALPRLSANVPPFPEHLADDALAGTAPGPVWAVAPASTRTPGLGRGHGMEFFRRLEELIDTRCEKYRDRTPLFLEVPGIKVPPTESSRVAGPISVDRIPVALDTAGVDTLLVAMVWSTDEVRARVKAAMAAHWGLGQVADSSETEAAGGRIKVVFLHDKAGALSHGPRTSVERQRDLEEMLAPYTGDGVRIAAICETDWDPDRWYPTIAARDTAEAQDGKWPSKQALARLGVTSQYVKQAPPPVPTHTKDGKPYNEKYRAKKVASRQSGLDSSTANVLREVLTGVGATDHRLGSAFGRLPLEPWWHIGVHVRRHARRRAYGRRRASTPAPLTVTLTAMRPTGGPDASWQIWAYSPQAGHWAAHGPATTALHATDLPWDVTPYDTVGDESPQASAAAQIVEQALVAARTQLPEQAPTVLYVDGDAAEYIWAGLTDEALGQDPPAALPRPASWLPGHSLPRAQRPLATVRVIGDLERIGRPTGAHMRTSGGTWRATDTTNSLFQLAHDGGTHLYPDFLLVNVPRTYAASPSGRFGKDETRFDSDRQNKNGYAHTATRFTVIGQSINADCNLIGAVAAVLTNQGITSDVRQSKPTPLHLARRMDSTHPYHRRTTEKEDESPGTCPEDMRADTTATGTDNTHGTKAD
ncbi:RNaseH domain-containing protein [Streptomyces sp. NPDC058620]|uniref:RNaseH domain-containing protein n=1 Tax=Streptomyces sp. NPDC058620 TaxID=3346560 RepID=UPI003657790A